MADAPAAQENEDGPPYPTYNECKAKGEEPCFVGPYERLIWPIKGEFPSAISVMKGRHQNIGDPEPLFNADTGEWHETARQSITDKKISFVEASLATLDEWDAHWMDFHWTTLSTEMVIASLLRTATLATMYARSLNRVSERTEPGVGTRHRIKRSLFVAAVRIAHSTRKA